MRVLYMYSLQIQESWGKRAFAAPVQAAATRLRQAIKLGKHTPFVRQSRSSFTREACSQKASRPSLPPNEINRNGQTSRKIKRAQCGPNVKSCRTLAGPAWRVPELSPCGDAAEEDGCSCHDCVTPPDNAVIAGMEDTAVTE